MGFLNSKRMQMDQSKDVKLVLSLKVIRNKKDSITMRLSPVVRPVSVRSVIALAWKEGLKLHQMDITTAFLNGDLEETIYMKQPEVFVAEGQEHLVCRLKNSLYGLKQSPRCWNKALDTQLKTMGLNRVRVIPVFTLLQQMGSSFWLYTSTTYCW